MQRFKTKKWQTKHETKSAPPRPLSSPGAWVRGKRKGGIRAPRVRWVATRKTRFFFLHCMDSIGGRAEPDFESKIKSIALPARRKPNPAIFLFKGRLIAPRRSKRDLPPGENYRQPSISGGKIRCISSTNQK